ncbi:DUF6207 family protein [Streptomyces sp. NPDC052012]|uniref:DUF6207 family protein n=1 Tax=Streptomyces sp. NPDC052012 TaxID=3155051 RepID=UPI00344F46C0
MAARRLQASRRWGGFDRRGETRDAGQPGVRLRMYTDLRPVPEEASLPEPAIGQP